jgi:hypothetical protein
MDMREFLKPKRDREPLTPEILQYIRELRRTCPRPKDRALLEYTLVEIGFLARPNKKAAGSK